jgi:hypothetical protein
MPANIPTPPNTPSSSIPDRKILPTLLKTLAYLLTPAVAFAAVFVVGYFYLYQGAAYNPSEPELFPFEQLTQTTPLSDPAGFVDVAKTPTTRGMLVVDMAHRNAFFEEELTTLVSRVADRGYVVEFMDAPEKGGPTPAAALGAQLDRANGLLIVNPIQPYTGAEVSEVQRFLERGGRVLLVADPGRPHLINSIGGPLGLEFQPDYLFNQVEYDLNFQHILVREFQPDALTGGLNELAFHTTGSVKSTGSGLAFTDSNTESSLSGRGGGASPIATGENRNVVGVYDLTFMVPPQNLLADNNQLVSNLADFLTGGQRQFDLAHFPDFFQGNVDIVLGDPSLVNAGTALRHTLGLLQIPAELREEEDLAADTVFLGLFDNAGLVGSYLEANGIRIDGSVSLPGVADIPPEGTAVITLVHGRGRQVLLILGDSGETLSAAVTRLTSGKFQDGLVNDYVGVYKTE